MKKTFNTLWTCLLILSFCCLPVGCIFTERETVQPDISPAPQDTLQIIEKQQQQIDTLEQENSKLRYKLSAEQKLVAGLQMDLLEKHSEADTIRQTNENLVNELARSKVNLRTRGSRLETLTLVAEVSAYVDTFQGKALTPIQRTTLNQAEQHLKEGKTEIEKENYTEAAYLFTKAMEQLRHIESEESGLESKVGNIEVVFFSPLRLKLIKNSNMRKKPSFQGDVVTIIKAGTTVAAIGYQESWVKVSTGAHIGWIHYSLLH